jgi:hypothetical protein
MPGRARRWSLKPFVALVSLVVAGLLGAGCGGGDDLNVKEGEPVDLGDLNYNVQLTRFLNPNDVEDTAYLVGAPTLPPGENYLGVFVKIKNTGDTDATIPTDFKITDTEHKVYKPVASKSPFALDLGGKIGPGETIPASDTTAANGPIQGAMIPFVLKDASTENRPLELTIPGNGETGQVKLDI